MLSCWRWRWPATASGEYHNQPATVKGELSKDLVPERPGKITAREKRLARIWGTAPWLALAGVTIAPPAALMLAYLLSGFSPLFLVQIGRASCRERAWIRGGSTTLTEK